MNQIWAKCERDKTTSILWVCLPEDIVKRCHDGPEKACEWIYSEFGGQFKAVWFGTTPAIYENT